MVILIINGKILILLSETVPYRFIIALSEAEAASLAYIRSQPSGASGTGARHSLSRAAISSTESTADVHDRRNVKTRRAHQHRGDDLVAGTKHYEAIKVMTPCHSLQIVRDQFARRQDIFHAPVPARKAVAGSDHSELAVPPAFFFLRLRYD